MKARDSTRLSAIRMLLSALQAQAKDSRRDPTEPEEIDFLATQAKRRRESIDAFTAAGRDDLADVERGELAIIESYLPTPLSSDEVAEIVRAAVASTGATSRADMGKVMAAVMPELRGRFDGKAAKELVMAALS